MEKTRGVIMVEELNWTTVSTKEVEDAKYRLEATVFKIDARAAHDRVVNSKYGSVKLWSKKGFVLNAYYPDRFKRVYVDKVNGYPMILPSQMTSIKPVPTKFISKKTEYDILKLAPDTLLLTRSGTIGICSIVSKTLAGKTMSDDVIRVSFKDINDLGYTYAFIRTKTGQLTLSTSKYGSVIKHIEPEHLEDIDVPNATNSIKKSVHEKIVNSFSLRDKSNELLDEAEQLLIKALKLPLIEKIKPAFYDSNFALQNFSVPLNQLNDRLDGSYHIPIINSIIDCLLDNADRILPLGSPELTEQIILPGRFKRHYVDEEHGTVFIGGKQIHELDPSNKKYLSIKKHGSRIDKQLFLKENMIAVTCSGTIGRVNLIPKHWEDWTMNQHVMRAIPINKDIAGYLYVWLNSEYGKTLIVRHTYGSVIDEIDSSHLSKVQVPILRDKALMERINTFALEANKLRSEAYYLEQEAMKEINDKVIFADATNKGLTDKELIAKYEHGAIDLKKPIKAMLKTPSNSSVLKDKKKE